MAEVMLGGVWLHSLGHVADVTWSSAWGAGPCGPAQASCTVAVDPSNDSTLLRLNATFEVWDKGIKRFGGVLSEMGRDFPRSLSARGWVRRAGDFDAVDSSGNPTSNPRTAVTQAIANGLPWSNPTAFDNTSLATDDDVPSTQRLDVLLGQWGVTVGKRWGVDVNGVAFATTDPTTPSWFLDASDLDIGVADDGLFTRVRARYVSGVDSSGNPNAWSPATADDAVAQTVYGVIEYPMDLTSKGQITGTTAAAYASQQLAQLTVPQWLSRVTTNSQRLLTAGGLPAHLPSVAAGQMVRLFNVPTGLGGLRNELGLDVVLGEVEFAAENAAEVTIAPLGLAVRTISDVVAQAAQVAQAVGATKRAGNGAVPVWIGHGGT